MSKKTTDYYRLTKDADIEGTPREKGFLLILDEKKAEYYAGVLEPVEAPTEEGEPIVEPEPRILTLEDLEEEGQEHPADIPIDAPEGTYADFKEHNPDKPAPKTTTRKAK